MMKRSINKRKKKRAEKQKINIILEAPYVYNHEAVLKLINELDRELGEIAQFKPGEIVEFFPPGNEQMESAKAPKAGKTIIRAFRYLLARFLEFVFKLK